MSVLSRRSTRIAATLAPAMVAASLTVAVSPVAVADDPPAPSLAWEISQQFDDHLSTHTLSDGAEEDENGVVTFPDGVGSYNPANGTASIAYGGEVKGAFLNPSTQVEVYSITLADPIVTVGDGGAGEVTAVVTSAVGETVTGPERVQLTTFDADESDWTAGDPLGSLTRTPDWLGVIPANSQTATDLGIGADKPVDGGAWSPEFLGSINSGLRAHFYASGSGSDAKKLPADFTAEAAAMTVSPTITDINPEEGLTIKVDGTGFNGQTNAGDNGVYVGIAEAGGLPDVSSQEENSFAGAAWVPAGAITDGAFSAVVNAPVGELQVDTLYAVYTWQAHTHSNTSQDTETALPFNFAQLESSPSASAVIGEAAEGVVPVTVTGENFAASTNPGDAGVYVGIAESGGLPDVSSPGGIDSFLDAAYVSAGQLGGGSFTTQLDVEVGEIAGDQAYSVYTWQAHTHSNTSQDTETELSTQPAVSIGLPRSLRYGAGGAVRVSAPSLDGLTVGLRRNGKLLRTLTVADGGAKFGIPRGLGAGRYTYRVDFAGDPGSFTLADTAAKPLTIRKAAVNMKLRVPVKPRRAKSGKAVVRVWPKIKGAPPVAGKVKVVLIKGGKVRRTVTTRKVAKGPMTIRLGKARARGKWTVKATYRGSGNNLGASRQAGFWIK